MASTASRSSAQPARGVARTFTAPGRASGLVPDKGGGREPLSRGTVAHMQRCHGLFSQLPLAI